MLVSSGRHAGSRLQPAQQPSVIARCVLVVAIRTVSARARTADIAQLGDKVLSTKEMGDVVLAELARA